MAKGINNETRGTTLKKFKPSPDRNNGLSIGVLTDVSITNAEVKEDSGMESFRGKTIPRLNFVFESRNDPKGVKPSTYIHSYLAVEHTPESITKEGSWRTDQMFGMIKHFLDVYRDNKLLTKEEEAMLTLDFVDEQDGVFVPQEADVVIAAYEKFFNNVIAIFKPDGKAIYKDINGKEVLVWMKLILDIKGKLVNNGDYGFPGYPGEGVIELYYPSVPCSLSINIAKGENIIPKPPVPAAAPPVGGQGGHATVADENLPSFMRG